jgi:hypothetical protein
VEDDHFLKTVPVILDPATPAEHQAAVADFFAHDLDFIQWRDARRQRLSGLFPATVTFAEDQADFETQLCDADGAVVESFVVTSDALENAPRLHVVHKFGHLTANIDERACAARNIAVHRVRCGIVACSAYKQSSSGSSVCRRNAMIRVSSSADSTVECGAAGPIGRSSGLVRFRHLATVLGLIP